MGRKWTAVAVIVALAFALEAGSYLIGHGLLDHLGSRPMGFAQVLEQMRNNNVAYVEVGKKTLWGTLRQPSGARFDCTMPTDDRDRQRLVDAMRRYQVVVRVR